jgi:ABC-type polysaccharide/polyol phosphate transport system ATPase subunit
MPAHPAQGFLEPARATMAPESAARPNPAPAPVPNVLSPRPPEVPAGPEPAIDVRDLGIRYDLRLTKRSTLKGSLAEMVGRKQSRPTHFWALRDVTFRVEHGESVGIIGPNGAGKSTLLLALAGILGPTVGEVRLSGKVSTLLTLGAGFEQEITGRENIDLAGAFLGIDHRTIQELTPSIIEFADIGAFIDAPVKTYSTGMRARLGFSIATAIQPDILLLDEVLGTGDEDFRGRSQARIRDLMKKAKAIVLVTHDLMYVAEFCNRAILMEAAHIVHDGDPTETVELYRVRIRERKRLLEAEAERFSNAPLIERR